ncbi:phospholipase D-like domain-containing protein [Ottowia testudinis]|uniref:phospholipase D n=1 Tax=Ottowia testudinis TaxID=2816950 RepID=A0A975CE26_9BURK|nr:phospholipase D-like domain-containing protein [Ottowia testudinis]QTD44142.1 hypothetical protein J1M35_13495 [Ottowia testudinis]
MVIELRAFANGDDCLVVWKTPEIADCLGFAIGRERKRPSGIEQLVLPNRLGFKGEPMAPGETRPSTTWPFQRYDWTDHSVSTGDEVRYCVTPVIRLTDGSVAPNVSQAADWTPWVTLTPTAGDTSVYFNRGLVMSQFMARALKGDYSVKALKKFKANLKDHEDGLRKFLGGDLLGKLLSLLAAAKSDGLHVWAALYELSDSELIDSLGALRSRAHLILSNGSDKSGDGNAAADKALRDTIDLHRRMLKSKGLGHNKFVVFTNAKREPLSVWTGSTNWAETGLCTQVNNGILVEDAALAADYLAQWDCIKEAGDDFTDPLKTANSELKQVADRYSVYFTPTKRRVDMDYAGSLIESAKESILFLMFKPGTNGLLNDVQQARLKDKGLYLYGVINDLTMAVTQGAGDQKQTAIVKLVSDEVTKKYPFTVLEPEGVKAPLATWAAEVTRKDFFSSNQQFPTVGHAIIHAKVMVIDAFGENPLVITGSHNFSDSASRKNDENLLVVHKNRDLALKYSVAIAAVYDHYRWRALLANGKVKDPGLDPKPQWQKRKRSGDTLRKIDYWVR